MCGPFTRDLRQAPAGLIEHLKALQRQQQLQSDGFCLPFDVGVAAEQQQPGLTEKADFEPLAVSEAADVGWTFLDEAAIPDLDAAPVYCAPEAPMPVPEVFVAPEDLTTVQQQCGWASMSSDGAAETSLAPSAFGTLSAPSFPDRWTDWSVPSSTLPPMDFLKQGPAAQQQVPPRAPKQESHSEASDHDSHVHCHGSGHSTEDEEGEEGGPDEHKHGRGKGRATADQLPKGLVDHPCAATLLSAGIRIKGRSQEELLQVAERIKKRRRASAARCRARRANHVHILEDENEELKAENARLKQRIAELARGELSRMDLLTEAQMDPMTHLEFAS